MMTNVTLNEHKRASESVCIYSKMADLDVSSSNVTSVRRVYSACFVVDICVTIGLSLRLTSSVPVSTAAVGSVQAT